MWPGGSSLFVISRIVTFVNFFVASFIVRQKRGPASKNGSETSQS